MKKVSEVYRKAFFKGRKSLNWRVPIVCKAIIDTFGIKPEQAIVDAGCAIGDYVKGFNDMGQFAWGIEGSEAARQHSVSGAVIYHDLRTPWPFSAGLSGWQHIKKSQLCICLEVAEHIDEEYVDIFLNNLCDFANKILLTAAPPGQKGHGHVNCQEKEYWVQKMAIRGYTRNSKLEQKFKRTIEEKTKRKEVRVYSKNCMVFDFCQECCLWPKV